MFSNMKVAVRLAIGFGAVVVLLLAISAVSLSSMAALNHDVDLLMDDRYPKVMLANEAATLTIDNGRQVRSMMLATSLSSLASASATLTRFASATAL